LEDQKNYSQPDKKRKIEKNRRKAKGPGSCNCISGGAFNNSVWKDGLPKRGGLGWEESLKSRAFARKDAQPEHWREALKKKTKAAWTRGL